MDVDVAVEVDVDIDIDSYSGYLKGGFFKDSSGTV